MIEPSAVIHRLDELRADVAEGERALHDLDARREQLVGTLLRLSGAVQVLEELLPGAQDRAQAVAGRAAVP